MIPAPTYQQLPDQAQARLAEGVTELVYAPFSTATWRTTLASGAVGYLKAGRVGLHPGLGAERRRCLWLAAQGVSVPEVIDHGSDGRIEWLATRALPGRPASSPEHLGDPERTVRLLADGLRELHGIDATGCPFDHRVERAMAHASRRVTAGQVAPHDLHDEHRHLSPESALARLRELVPEGEQDLVVCHGDYCAPNVLLDGAEVAGYVDLGEVGVAERWRDLAVATWSITWNLGPGYEGLFLDRYGVDLDPRRRDFYRLLYDLEA
jgi:kanamycin kinase